MAALTADVDIPHLGTPTKLDVKAIGADTFYKGSLVFADATSGKAQLVPAINDTFLGICAEQTVAAAADDLVPIYVDGIWALAFTGATDADAGQAIIVDMDGTLSDNEADLVSAQDAAPIAGDTLIGKCLGVSAASSTRAWVMLHAASGSGNALGWL